MSKIVTIQHIQKNEDGGFNPGSFDEVDLKEAKRLVKNDEAIVPGFTRGEMPEEWKPKTKPKVVVVDLEEEEKNGIDFTS